MKKIQFMAMSIEVEDKYPKPQAASHYVPDWYKKAKRFRSGKMEILPEGAGLNKDLKLCMPFLDAITAGYVIELPGDLLVHRDERGVGFFWNEQPDPMQVRPKDMAVTLPRPHGHDKDLYAWTFHWAAITPPGYSLLVTQPLNRFDLPFTTTSGIMDGDKFSLGGEIPFFLEKDFVGVIPAGTPIAQLIPIKREYWTSEVLSHNQSFIKTQMYNTARYLYGGYKKHIWVKKSYE
jgi:hypothetical protein